MNEADGPSEFYDTDTVRKFALTEEDITAKNEVVCRNNNEISEGQKKRILKDAVRNWDLFYKRNADNFFKDRAWLAKELPEIAAACREVEERGASEAPLLIDVGCGVGNSLVPILLANPRIQAVAFDCSPRAVAILRERWSAVLNEKQGQGATVIAQHWINPCDALSASVSPCPDSTDSIGSAATRRTSSQDGCGGEAAAIVQKPVAASVAKAVANGEAQIFHCSFGQLHTVAAFDITAGDVPGKIAEKGSGDFALLIFVLSALHPCHHVTVAKRCAELLKPGGMVLFRDYGRLDMAQIRFAEQGKPKIEQNLYARYDGTLAYYFLKEEVEDLFCKYSGLEVVENRYCMREMLNRKTQQKMQRIWVQAKFRRPLS